MKTEDGLMILYEDETCLVTELYIKIYKYFFPLATSRTIMFEDVDKITLDSADDVTTIWGPSTHHMNNWFPLDQSRREKRLFISIHEKGKRIIPSLTPADAVAVFNVLLEKFISMGRKHPPMEENHNRMVQMKSEGSGESDDPHKIHLIKKEEHSENIEQMAH